MLMWCEVLEGEELWSGEESDARVKFWKGENVESGEAENLDLSTKYNFRRQTWKIPQRSMTHVIGHCW